MKSRDLPCADDRPPCRLSPASFPGQRLPRLCDRPRLLFVQNCPEEGIGIFETRLQELAVPWLGIHPYAGDRLPPLDCCDAIIVGGTPISVNRIQEHEFLLAEARWLKEALDLSMPILGICFGAQLLARLLGGEVKKSPVMELGAYPVRLTSAGRVDPLFQGFPKAFPVFQWHADAFDIPPWGLRLASGWECPNQGFRMGSTVGLQFHLEVTPDEAEHWTRVYSGELPAVGKSRTKIVRECRAHEPLMAELAALLLDNFLASVKDTALR